MESDAIITLLILLSGALAVSNIGFAIAWVRARERAIRGTASSPTALSDERTLERLYQGQEAVALEVERIAEAQRFLTKVLSERNKGSAS